MFDWSSTPVRAGAFIVTLAFGAILGPLVENTLLALMVGGVGALLMLGGTWWWKRGFRFPAENQLRPRITVRDGESGRVWGIELEAENSGRTDEFEFRIEGILGTKAPTGAVGTYPKWRGETVGDAKLIRRGDRATVSLCSWEPMVTMEGLDPTVVATVHASTGDQPVELTEAGVKFDGLERHELVYQLRMISDKTEDQVRYDVHVGTTSSADPSPVVHVEKIDGF